MQAFDPTLLFRRLPGRLRAKAEDMALSVPLNASLTNFTRVLFDRDRYAIGPRWRAIFPLMLMSVDILAVYVGVGLLSPSDSRTRLVCSLVCIGIFQFCGLYAIASSIDLQKSGRGAFALTLTLLPMCCSGILATYGLAAAIKVTQALTLAAFIGMAGRLIISLVVTLLSNALIDRVIVVGRCGPVQALLGSNRVNGERVCLIGQVAVDEGECVGPLLGRIGTAKDAGLVPLAAFEAGLAIADRVIVVTSNLTDKELRAIAQGLESVTRPVHFISTLSPESMILRLTDGFGPVVREAPASSAIITKRLLDLLIAVPAALVLAPALLTIGCLVRLETPGPALFRQVRLGRGNRPFVVFKFRTMRADAPAADGSVQATKGDARVTRMGAILRKTSLDELPQLFNVINGSMSLVGPRPHPTELNRRFVSLIEGYSERHRVTPGMTGWAQVNGARGETRTIEQMRKRVELDLEYIRGQSIAFDLWIILRTLVAVASLRNAY